MTLAEAIAIMSAAEKRLANGDVPVDPAHVLGLALSSRCSGYDSEFVTIAQLANVPLVTADAKLIANFPQLAVSPEDFAPA